MIFHNMIPTLEKQQTCRLEFDHLEILTAAASSVTVEPVKSLLYYLVPFVGAWVAWHQELRPGDHLQDLLITESAKLSGIEQVNRLKELAGISQKITVYTSDSYTCSSFGGACSFTSPVISIPRGFLTQPPETLFDDHPTKGSFESPSNYRYTADESLFFIAREVASIKSNNSLIQLAAKVFFISSIFFLCASAVPVLAGAALMALALAFHVIAERLTRMHLDVDAVHLLKDYFQDEKRAVEAGRTAISKLIKQNIERRSENTICRLYLTEKGNNFLDINHPFLTTRLNRLNEAFPSEVSKEVIVETEV